jgi:predicted O-methyltransferase YrrM
MANNDENIEFPEMVDFGKLKIFGNILEHPTDNWSAHIARLAYEMGYIAFNDAPELAVFLAFLKYHHQIDTAVETGTFLGSTTRFLSTYFNNVHTIEVSEPILKNAKLLLQYRSNIQCHLGSSEKVLKEILPSLQGQRLFFYLDAHWNTYWPLRDELEEISQTHKDNCIIAIDDFKVPGRKDIPFDEYAGHSCSFEYIENNLSKVFTDYTHHYIIPKDVQRRAKFLAIPKQWLA